jgi:hypothetical protein
MCVKAKRRARTASQKKSEGDSESEPDASDNETLHATDVELSFKNLFQDIRTTIGATHTHTLDTHTHTHTHVCTVGCVICGVYHPAG